MPDDLFTTGETVADPADTTSAQLTPDELRALAGFHHEFDRGANARDAYAPAAGRRRDAPEDSTYITRILERIEPWHATATPPAVVEAREALDAAIAADQAARQAFAELPGREAAERDAVGRAAVAGEEIPALADWYRERVILLAQHAALARQTKAAGQAYQDAVRNSLSAWRDAQVSRVAEARQEAQRSFQGVEAAMQRFEAAKQAAQAIDAATFPDDPLQVSPMPSEVSEVLNRGKGAARALAAYLNSDHPVVTGEYLRREGQQLRPPLWVREAIANEGAASSWSQLMAIEIAEGFKFTDFTRAEAQHFVPDAQGELRPRDPRSGDLGWDDRTVILAE